MCQRQFGGKIQPQVLTYSYLLPLSPHHHTSSPHLITIPHHHTSSPHLITIPNHYTSSPYLITIPPNLIGRKQTSFSKYSNLALTHTVLKNYQHSVSKHHPASADPPHSKRQVEHRQQIALSRSVRHLVLSGLSPELVYQKGKKEREKKKKCTLYLTDSQSVTPLAGFLLAFS